jgi:apolipoprotein N-acyltransferase
VVVAVVIVGQALAALMIERRPRTAAPGLAVVLALVAGAALAPRAEVVREVDVALVQGGGPQRTRASYRQQPIVLSRHWEATRLIDRPVDLIVWPENVVNPGRFLARADADALIRRLAAETDASVLAGWFYAISDHETVNYQSTITPEGDEIDRYDKVRIVPFGEYVPLRGLIELLNDEIPSRDVVVGTADPVLDTPVGPVGVSISWEGFFETRARASVRAGAELLTNPTNGSSYWLTQVQTQQVASNQLRAIETDRWVLQVAPTGFSAVVDPDGNVIQRTGISERAALVETVEMRQGQTLATRVGFWPVLGLGLVAVAYTQYRWRWGRGQRSGSAGPPPR